MPERYFRVDLAGTLLIGCRDCGALVWDTEKHDTVLHLWERSDEPAPAHSDGSDD